MCIEFAWKKAGIPLVRNFAHGYEGVLGGIPWTSSQRFFVGYKINYYSNGKKSKTISVDSFVMPSQQKVIKNKYLILDLNLVF